MNNFSYNTLQQTWLIKYKLYHFLFWALYHFMWGVAEYSLSDVLRMILYTSHYVAYVFFVVLHTLAGYINLYYLLPKYLEKGKLIKYIFYLVLCIVITSTLLTYSFYASAYLTGKTLDYFCSFGENASLYDVFRYHTTKVLPSTAGAILLGLSIKLAKNWSQAQKREQALEKEKLETELKFLKNQFNPHFLFNTINSIFFLIHKDPKMASAALAKFSELLRYQLYECNEKQILVDQEITYLENFVALEKLRQNQDCKVQIKIERPHHRALGIAPFILLTFVENAFKHVSKNKYQSNWIAIQLNFLEENKLYFEVSNSKSDTQAIIQEAVHYGGIGLKNVKRRLELIYPEQYHLEIENHQKVFSVRLHLALSTLTHTFNTPQEVELLSKL